MAKYRQILVHFKKFLAHELNLYLIVEIGENFLQSLLQNLHQEIGRILDNAGGTASLNILGRTLNIVKGNSES